jgi:hypothetical protein
MMFGVGIIMMILVFGLPVVLVVALIWGLSKHPVSASPLSQQTPARACSHCGAGLQAGWTHCRQCGASINPA